MTFLKSLLAGFIKNPLKTPAHALNNSVVRLVAGLFPLKAADFDKLLQLGLPAAMPGLTVPLCVALKEVATRVLEQQPFVPKEWAIFADRLAAFNTQNNICHQWTLPSMDIVIDRIMCLSVHEFKAAIMEGVETTLIRHGLSGNEFGKWVQGKVRMLYQDPDFLLSLKKFVRQHNGLALHYEVYSSILEFPMKEQGIEFYIDHRMDASLLGTEVWLVENAFPAQTQSSKKRGK